MDKFFVIHLLRTLAEEILHKSSEWCVLTVRPVDIKDMRSIIERSLKFLNNPLHMMERIDSFIDINMRNYFLTPFSIYYSIPFRYGKDFFNQYLT